MSRDLQLEKVIAESLAEYSPRLSWENNAYRLKAGKAVMNVEVVWPYPLMEVYFDFTEKEEKVFSESVEFYEGESNSELAEYIVHVVRRFLDNPARIEKLGILLKRTELQVSKDGKWINVFD